MELQEYISKSIRVKVKDGRYFYGSLVCTDRNCDLIVDEATEKRPDLTSFKSPGYAGYSVRYSPFFDNKLALASAANYGLVGNGRLSILDIRDDGHIVVQTHFDTQDGLFCLAWSELNENQVVTGSGDNTIRLFDITTKQPFPIRAFNTEHQKEVYSINWNMVDRTSFCSSSWDGTIKVWVPERLDSLMTLKPQIAYSALTRSSQPLPEAEAHSKHGPNGPNGPGSANNNSKDCVYSAKFSPRDGNVIASAVGDSSAQLFDLRNPKVPVLKITNAHVGMECLTLDWNKYQPTILATGGVDKLAKVWDTRNTSIPLNEFVGHDYAVRSLEWSPHSPDLLLTTSYDMTARVWRDTVKFIRGAPGNNKLVGVFDKHTEFVTDGNWSLWGEPGWIATTGWDEMLYLWKG